MYGERYLAHYGVVGMRWGHRKARIEERKERQRKYATAHPKLAAIGTALKTGVAFTAVGLAATAVSTSLLKSKAHSVGKVRAAGILANIGSLTVASSAIAGLIAGASVQVKYGLGKKNKS